MADSKAKFSSINELITDQGDVVVIVEEDLANTGISTYMILIALLLLPKTFLIVTFQLVNCQLQTKV